MAERTICPRCGWRHEADHACIGHMHPEAAEMARLRSIERAARDVLAANVVPFMTDPEDQRAAMADAIDKLRKAVEK